MADFPNHIDIKHETVHAHLVRDNIVDILGSLVPGLVFTTLMVPAIALPTVIAVYQIPDIPTYPLQLAELLSGPISWDKATFVIVPFIAIWLLASYILGFIFFRQDPKLVDRMSARRIARKTEDKDRDGLFFEAIESRSWRFPFIGLTKTFPFIYRKVFTLDAGNVEFPYINIKNALQARGVHYLSDKIPWDENNKSDYIKRTKHYANALKLRILMERPEEYSILARNEAHVRLSSSMWFICHSLRHFSLLGLDLYIGLVLLFWAFFGAPLEFSILVWFPPLIIYLSAVWASIAIENTFHYQRTREIMFILETGYWLEKTNKIPNLFDGIIPRAVATRSSSGAPPAPVKAAGSG
jgi:hypothetical protein